MESDKKFNISMKSNERLYSIPPMIENNAFVFWGSDNAYPYELLELYHSSNINKSIINTKVNLICGDKIVVNKSDIKPMSDTSVFINSPNSFENLYSLLYKFACDLEIFGGFAIRCIWSNDGKTISQIFHIPLENLRMQQTNELDMVDKFIYKKTWRGYMNYKTTEYQALNIDPSFNKKYPDQILYIKKYTAGIKYYPIPTYSGGINWISSNVQLARFYDNYIKNGMSPSMIIKHPQAGDVAVLQQFYDDLLEQFAGSENAGKFILIGGNGLDNLPQVDILNADNVGEKFNTVQDIVLKNICYAHQINPIVAGISTEGTLGQRQEMIDARAMYKADIISKEQDLLLSGINKILTINGYSTISIESNELTETSEQLIKEEE